MINSEAVTALNGMTLSQVDSANQNVTGDYYIAPLGVAGSGISGEDKSDLESYLNDVLAPAVENDVNPNLSGVWLARKDPC